VALQKVATFHSEMNSQYNMVPDPVELKKKMGKPGISGIGGFLDWGAPLRHPRHPPKSAVGFPRPASIKEPAACSHPKLSLCIDCNCIPLCRRHAGDNFSQYLEKLLGVVDRYIAFLTSYFVGM